MSEPQVGSRVVLRYRRPAGSVPSQTDVIGFLEALRPRVGVRGADGTLTTVDPADVVVLKSIPPRPVRTGSIRKLEHAIALSVPDVGPEWVAGWLAVLTGAVPLADPSMPEGGYFHDLLGEPTLRALAAWYAGRGLPLRLRLPDRLVRPPASWPVFDERLLLTLDLPAAGAGDDPHPSDRVLLAAAPDDAPWAGLVLGESPGDFSGRLAALLGAAARFGAGRVWLEVSPDRPALEDAARGLGFGDHHRVRHVRLELAQSATSGA